MKAGPALVLALAVTPAAAIELGEFSGVHETLVAERLGGRPSLGVSLECASGCIFSIGEARKIYPKPDAADSRRGARAISAIKKAYPAAEVRGCIDLDATDTDSPMACKLERGPWNKPTVILVPPPGASLLVLWRREGS